MTLAPTTDPIAAVRRDLRRLQDLYAGNLLTPERLKAIVAHCEISLAAVDEQLRDDEGFEITLEGLQTLHKCGRPVRWRGHLAVIEGERS